MRPVFQFMCAVVFVISAGKFLLSFSLVLSFSTEILIYNYYPEKTIVNIIIILIIIPISCRNTYLKCFFRAETMKRHLKTEET